MSTTPYTSHLVPNLGRDGWLSEAWQLFKNESGTWVVVTLASGILAFLVAAIFYLPIELGSGMFDPLLAGHHAARSHRIWTYPLIFVAGIVCSLPNCYFGAGMIKIAIASIRREPIAFNDLFSGRRQTLPLFVYNLPVVILSGLISLYIEMEVKPTVGYGSGSLNWVYYAYIIAHALLMSVVYLFIAPGEALTVDGIAPAEALRRSFAACKSNFWHYCGVSVILGMIYILSICTCGIGLLVTIPMVFIVVALSARDTAGLPVPIQAMPAGPAAIPGAWPPAPGVWPPSPTAPTLPTEPSPMSAPTETTPPLAGPKPAPTTHDDDAE